MARSALTVIQQRGARQGTKWDVYIRGGDKVVAIISVTSRTWSYRLSNYPHKIVGPLGDMKACLAKIEREVL